MAQSSTIFALSSAPGRAAVAVVRVSGPRAEHVLRLLARRVPEPRRAAFATLADPTNGSVIDQALVLFFRAPASETGEDVAELQVHGGRAVIQALLETLGGIEGCRMAEPGEFARRAFENGRIDLTTAEGIADLVDAETEAQRRQAVRQAGGALAKLYESWRSRVVEAQSLIEAGIDFSDEADVSSGVARQAEAIARELVGTIDRHLADRHRGEILREGFKVVLAGPPNVGKSSLLNTLARRDAAIVSDEPGTTRDVVEVRLDLGGWPVVVSDTAGIREAANAVEQEGIRRSLEHGRGAELVLWLNEAGRPAEPPPDEIRNGKAALLTVLNKCDLPSSGETRLMLGAADTIQISARTGQGLDALIEQITALAAGRLGGDDGAVITSARHRACLDQARQGLSAFIMGIDKGLELRAEDLRLAASAIGRITGRVDPETVLDQIFGRFCIGK